MNSHASITVQRGVPGLARPRGHLDGDLGGVHDARDDRKVAKETDRSKRREHWAEVREAISSGDDTYLPSGVRKGRGPSLPARWGQAPRQSSMAW